MLGKMLRFVVVLAIAGGVSMALAGNSKGADKEGESKEVKKVAEKGKESTDGHGRLFEIDITLQKLYEVLVGEQGDAEKIECSICQEALKTNGVCTECKIGFVNGTLYRSPFAYTLNLGEPVDPAKPSGCSHCKKAMAENEFCKECNVGFVAHRKFKSLNDHHYAIKALERIKEAVAKVKECETCAVAIATNGNCPKCKIAYRVQRASP